MRWLQNEVERASNPKGSETSKPHSHSSPGEEGQESVSKLKKKKKMLRISQPSQEPELGEDRTSEDLKLGNFRGAWEVVTS